MHRYYVEYNGSIWPVIQVPEQYDALTPKDIDCILVAEKLGSHLEQHIPTLIRRHYHEGQEQMFIVKSINNDKCTLVDIWGYNATANVGFFELEPKQKIIAKVISIGDKSSQVEITEILESEATFFSFGKSKLRKVLKLNEDDKTYDSLFSLLLKVDEHWAFDMRCLEYIERNAALENGKKLKNEHDIALRLLEYTSFLHFLALEERKIFKNHLILFIENVDYFIEACNMMNSGNFKHYVTNLTKKLTISGSLYNPRKQLHKLLCLCIISPTLIRENSAQVFEAIAKRDVSWWQTEDLDEEFILVLQFFLQFLLRRSDDTSIFAQAQRFVLALALQQNLSNSVDSKLYNPVINRTMLLRHAADLKVEDPSKILELAFDNLVGTIAVPLTVGSPSVWSGEVVANIVAKIAENAPRKSFTPYVFKGNKCQMIIDADSISITSDDVTDKECYPAIPTALNLWHNIQVSLPVRITEKHYNSVTAMQNIWNEIDTQLFNREIKVEEEEEEIEIEVDDIISFIVQEVINDNMVEGIIVDPPINAKARIAISDIVRYNVKGLTLSCFQQDEQPLILSAQIKSKEPNGGYMLKMLKLVDEFVEHYHQNQRELISDYSLICRINTYNASPINRYIGISDMGFSVSVAAYGEYEEFSTFDRGAIIQVGNTDNVCYNGYIQGDYISTLDHSVMPDITDAFGSLMKIYSEGTLNEEDDEIEDDNKEQQLSKNALYELIAIIEHQSTLENDNVKALAYFGYCRTLARMMDDEECVTYYQGRMKLLRMLNLFADTDNLDEEVFEEEQIDENFFSQYTQLHRGLIQMKLVACLDKPKCIDELVEIRNTTTEPDLKKLASLVIAHNLLKEASSYDEATSVRAQVRDHLQLQRNETDKKYYGIESQNIEFKTSMVYPPDNGMKPNLQRQTNEILQQICAMLNSGGGRLYLGVNNSGYECGLMQDLKYFNDDKDKYTLHLDNAVFHNLGPVAARLYTREFDADATLPVLVISVDDANIPIALNGVYYERRNTSVLAVRDTETFLEMRQKQIDEQQSFQSQTSSDLDDNDMLEQPQYATEDNEVAEEEHPLPEAPEETNIETTEEQEEPIGNYLPTATLRNNVLHEYMPDYLFDHEGYICLLDDGKYTVQKDEVWEEYPLTLAIHEPELQGSLLCIYEDGCYTRTSIVELQERTAGKAYNRYDSAPIQFASIVDDDDILLLLLQDTKTNKYIRFENVRSFRSCSMSDAKELLPDLSFAALLRCDVISNGMIDFTDYRYTGSKALGIPVKSEEGKNLCSLLSSIGVEILDN